MLDTQSAVEFIKAQIKSEYEGDDLRFRLSSQEGPTPHHLAFQYWDHLYFVFVETIGVAIPGRVSLQDLLALSEAADATPVVVRLAPANGVWSLADGALHLHCARTGVLIDPPIVASNLNWSIRPNVMTPYDLQELAINVVSAHIEKAGGVIQVRYVGLPQQPSITFSDEADLNYVFVDFSLYPDLQPKFRRGILDSIGKLGLPLERCFWAPVGLANSKDAFDPSGEIPPLPITRRDNCFSKFSGLQPLPIANSEVRSSYTASDGEMLISYESNQRHDTVNYAGYIDFEDLNPFAQDRLITQAIQLFGSKAFRRYREASEFGAKKNQVAAI